MPREAKEFPALASRANYLAMDCPGAQFAVKEACRDMAAPTRASWQKMKRIARFLLEFPRLVWSFGGEPVELEILERFADSDWAVWFRTRRSTSGGVVMLGGRGPVALVQHLGFDRPVVGGGRIHGTREGGFGRPWHPGHCERLGMELASPSAYGFTCC